MQCIAEFCIVPIGRTRTANSVAHEVALVEKLIQSSGLKCTLHAFGTNIEGPMDEVLALLKRCHEMLHENDVARVLTNMKISTRTDKLQTMESKVQKVETIMRTI